jgi:hypothetical protein
MGKFLRDKDGNLVNINGGLVLEKNLDRKPRDCEQCGFQKWVKRDKIFIIQRNTFGAIPGMMQHPHAAAGGGGMEWICPDCALWRGLPPECYHKNFYATPTPEALRILQNYQLQRSSAAAQQQSTATKSCDAGWNLLDITGFMCSSGSSG